MNRLPTSKRVQILRLMVEGASLRAIARVVGVSINTVTRIQQVAGGMAETVHDYLVTGIKTRRIECDEIWSFVYAKRANVPHAKAPPPEAGDLWTWVALDPDTKLVLVFHVTTGRATAFATMFMHDLRARLVGRVQLSTDQLGSYLEAVEAAFGSAVDYAQSGKPPRIIQGQPDQTLIGTSYVERSNLDIRMAVRRYTRRVNAFSKRIANHRNGLALYYYHHNFIRPHGSLAGRTPAMVAGVAKEPFSWEWLLGLIDAEDGETAYGMLKEKAN